MGPPTAIEPTTFGDVLTWSFVAQPGVEYTITFDVLPTLTLGSTSLSGAARVVGTDISIPASASVTVVEGTEPNDFRTVDETTKAAEDIVYLTYIADADDIDVFEITVAEDDELVVELSNLDADLDVVLWGRQAGRHRHGVGPHEPRRAAVRHHRPGRHDQRRRTARRLPSPRRRRPDARRRRRVEHRRHRRRDPADRPPRRRHVLHPGRTARTVPSTCSRPPSSSRCSKPTNGPSAWRSTSLRSPAPRRSAPSAAALVAPTRSC